MEGQVLLIVEVSPLERKKWSHPLVNIEEGVEGAAVQRPYSMADFELIRVIGRGSYAKVLMVELRRTRRVYAMKVIKKELVTDDEVLRINQSRNLETILKQLLVFFRILTGFKLRNMFLKRHLTILSW